MQISFKDSKVRKLCEQKDWAKKKLGEVCARKLRNRLDDLAAAACVTDLVAGKPHPLKGDRAGQFALSLANGWRLVFVAANEPCPQHKDGSIDWSAITLIRIEYIGDYHD